MTRRLNAEQQQLAEAHLVTAQAVAAKVCRWRGDYDDVLGASYLGLCLAALHYDPRRGRAFATYSDRVCRHTIRRELGRHGTLRCGSQPVVVLDLAGLHHVSHEPGPAALAIRGEEWALVQRGLVGLPRRQREVIGLRLDGLHHAAIGRRLGITREMVSRHFSRAARRLRGGG